VEALLCEQLANALHFKYPGLIFHFDYGAGVHLTKNQAIKQARLNGRGYPDLNISAARGGKHGLYLELKAEGVRVWIKNGELVADTHIREQAAVLDRLRTEGYMAEFAIGFEMAMGIIHRYLAS